MLSLFFDSKKIRWYIFRMYQKLFMKMISVKIKTDSDTKTYLDKINNSDEKFVFLLNHQTYLDHWVSTALVKPCGALMAKENLYKPFTGLLMYMNNFIPVDRSKKSNIVEYVTSFCKISKTNLCVYPEGGFPAKIQDTLSDFRSGGFAIAKNLEYKIVLIVIDMKRVSDEYMLYPDNDLHVKIVEIIDPSGFDVDTLKNFCYNKMNNEYKKLYTQTRHIKSE
jgi:1-acyl-sn-glycerol-3-phosphate acyltransferase